MISLRQIYHILNTGQTTNKSLRRAIELDSMATSFVIDSRQVQKNSVFCAFVGQQVDGHDYINQALEKGANLIIATKKNGLPNPKIILVADVLQALQQLAIFWRQQLTNTKIVALTGSNGKTTIKNFLYSVLSQQAQCVSTQGNQNNEIGVPLTILSIPNTTKYAIIELGARKLGDITFLNILVKPHMVLISNIGNAHIGIFGSKQRLVEAKAEIFTSLSPEGTALLDADSEYQLEFLKKLPKQTKIRWLKHQPITLNDMPSRLKTDTKNHLIWDWQQGQSTFITPEGCLKIKLKLLGKHNAHNAAWAILIAQYLHYDLTQIERGLSMVKSEIGRLSMSYYQPKQMSLKNLQLTILNDSYNANPESTQQALAVVSQFTGKKIMVFADMLELGGQSKSYHLNLIQPIIDSGIEQLFLLGEHCHHINAYLNQKKMPNLNNHWYPDLLQLQRSLLTYLTELAKISNHQLTVLIKGSNGMQLSRIIETIKNL